jgi:hypothetical protein
MSRAGPSVLERLRQPEHTGENRCLPCTLANVAVAVVVSVLVGRRRRALGLAVLALSLAAISLRGYLVPGTPALTARYLPESVRRSVGKDPVAERLDEEAVEVDLDGLGGARENGADAARENGAGAGEVEAAASDGDEHDEDEDDDGPTFRTLEKMRRAEENEVDPEEFLLAAGVVEPADGEFAYRFTDEFAAAARERLPDDVDDVGHERIAPLFRVDPEELEPKDRDYPAYRVGVRVRKWPSAAARALDVAAFEAIDERTDEWADVPIQQRMDVLEWLRGFYDACPVCGGAVEFSDDVIESCCGQFNVTTLACADCGVHLREFDPSKVGNREDLKGITP